MARSCRGNVLLPLAVIGLSALAGCVDERIVYQDRELYEDPLSNAGYFVGYSDQAEQLTVCGNCHVEKQADWEGTGHAGAWAAMQASTSADASCGACHAVSESGNTVEVPAGFNATGEERYHDVQCESCHGPGIAAEFASSHVDNPLDANIPLAPLNVGADLTQGCGECHAGAHHPFAEEWNLSRHGEGANRPQYRQREGCSACHGGEGALEAWGIRTEFLEKGQGELIGITCAVCHDPHSAEFGGQLRFSVSTPDVDNNLCMKCHQRRAIPSLERASSGPHSPQGPLLLGEIGTVGWTPPNFAYDVTAIRGTHGSEANTRLCATCHVNSYDVTDPATGGHVFSATGHLFKPIPCVDAAGIPTADDTCARTVEARSFDACTGSGCHGDETAALSALTIAQNRIAGLVADLETLLAQVPADQFDNNDGVYTVAEGADFNAGLGAITSSAVHNPFLTEALLTASIDIVMSTYGLAAPAGVDLRNIMSLLSQSRD